MKQDTKETKEQTQDVREAISKRVDEKLASLSLKEDDFEERLTRMQMERRRLREELREKREQKENNQRRQRNSRRKTSQTEDPRPQENLPQDEPQPQADAKVAAKDQAVEEKSKAEAVKQETAVAKETATEAAVSTIQSEKKKTKKKKKAAKKAKQKPPVTIEEKKPTETNAEKEDEALLVAEECRAEQPQPEAKPLEEPQAPVEDIWDEIEEAMREMTPADIQVAEVREQKNGPEDMEDAQLLRQLDIIAKEMEAEQLALQNSLWNRTLNQLERACVWGVQALGAAKRSVKRSAQKLRQRREIEKNLKSHSDTADIGLLTKTPGLTFEKKSAILRRKYKEISQIQWRRCRRKTMVRERRLAYWLADRVELADRKLNVWSRRKLFRGLKHGGEQALAVLDWMEERKVILVELLAIALFVTAAVSTCIGHFTAYEYAYNGKVLGVTKNIEDVYKTIDAIGDKLGTALNTRVEIDKEKDITFRQVRGLHLQLDSKDEVLNNLTYMQDLKVVACGIYVGDEEIAILQNTEMAQRILSNIKGTFASADSGTYESVSFAESVELRNINVNLGEIENEEDVLEYMLTGAVERKIHTVQKGQTFSEIAKLYGLKQSELEAMNPGIVPEKLKIGQEIMLNRDRPVLTVQTIETATYVETIPFETVYEESSSMYEGESTVKREGVNGQQRVEARITKNNGEEISREILSTEVISQPVNKIVIKGTKKAPVRQGTGTFIWPLKSYRISSRYGSRWGRMHNGVDLAAPKGTKIYASDGGTVTFAGYKGSFGYLVIINHGGNLESYYAHCSKLLVKRGDKVYQGQNIALVGSTGRSTGPHCHFEIHYRGTARNPLSYL